MKKLLLVLTMAVGGYVAYKKSPKVRNKVNELAGLFKKGVKKGHEIVVKEVNDEASAA